MKLTQYAAQFCNALEAPNPEGKVITLNLTAEHKAYRDVIAVGIRSMFLGSSGALLDGLFHEKQQYLGAYQGALKKHAEWAFEKEEKRPVRGRPPRTIQSAPKKGRIPKAKIEKAVKEVKDKEVV